ncbi:MAG: hypothetical protein N3A67_01325 [Ignavibacteria bacterium]|nr:hypothetical protein [Ignavibacteria bacterium]
MMKKLSSVLILSILFGVALSFNANAQIDESFRIKLESILNKFKNYRFSTISIYRIKDIGDIRKAIRVQDEALTRTVAVADEACVKNADRTIVDFVRSQVEAGASDIAIKQGMLSRGYEVPADIDCIIQSLQSQGQSIATVQNVYVVTTRMERDQIVPSSIIAMLVSYDSEEDIEKSLRQVPPRNIYTNPELFAFTLDENEYRAFNMYELIVTAFRQGNVENKTLEAQGFGTFKKFAPKVYGTSQSLVKNEYEITPFDVQTFMRISDGQPLDYELRKNELILSSDLISWRHYEQPMIVYSDGYVDTLSTVTNQSLPQYGVELKYGIDEINYPSLWSERLTLSAIWENVKLGFILPTSGWASLSKDFYNVDRKLTSGSVGVSASGDFPIKVIPQSGIFNFTFGYIFGDANEPDYKNRKKSINDYPDIAAMRNALFKDEDYMIRFNASLHYTFGIAIDDDYWLRFGLGGTTYTADRWYNKVIEDKDNDIIKTKYVKKSSDNVTGISAKLDFMAKNARTPYGASIQYFDESVFANIWLSVPIVRNRVAVRFDAKGYTAAMKGKLRDWELNSVFMPTARLIFTF